MSVNTPIFTTSSEIAARLRAGVIDDRDRRRAAIRALLIPAVMASSPRLFVMRLDLAFCYMHN